MLAGENNEGARINFNYTGKAWKLQKDMQEAFQYGYGIEYGKSEELILPEEDINHSLNAKNSFALCE